MASTLITSGFDAIHNHQKNFYKCYTQKHDSDDSLKTVRLCPTGLQIEKKMFIDSTIMCHLSSQVIVWF
jgi:hypothetical protein